MVNGTMTITGGQATSATQDPDHVNGRAATWGRPYESQRQGRVKVKGHVNGAPVYSPGAKYRG